MRLNAYPTASSCLMLLFLASGLRGAGERSFELSTAEGLPGQEITMPLYFQGEPGGSEKRLLAEFRYPTEALEYRRLTDATITKQLVLEVTPGKNQNSADKTVPASTVLLLDVRQGVLPAIPSGVLGYLVFRIRPEARPRTTYTIDLQATATDREGAESRLAVKAGQVLIAMREDVFACFFYMH